MARYIDADKLKAYLHEDDFYTPDERWKPESEFYKMVDAIPTANVIEVACLCGECEWYNESRGVCYRNSWDNDRVDFVEATDGCKHGQKK